jgi:methyl-accepting chemotaxis protein
MKKVEDHLADDLKAVAGRVSQAAQSAFWLAFGTTIALLAITAVLGILIVRGITRPLGAMTMAMQKLAGGDTSVEVPALDNRDEVGDMAHAVQVFKDNMIKVRQLSAEQRSAEQMVEEERKEKRRQAIEGYIAGFERSVGDALKALACASTELDTTAQSMAAAAKETHQQSMAVAAASEQASRPWRARRKSSRAPSRRSAGRWVNPRKSPARRLMKPA